MASMTRLLMMTPSKRKAHVAISLVVMSVVVVNYILTLKNRPQSVGVKKRTTYSNNSVVKVIPDVVVAPLPEKFHPKPQIQSLKTDLETLYKKRRETVKKVCNEMNISTMSTEILSSQLWEMKDLGVMFCPVPQTSGTWKKTMEIWTRSKEGSRASLLFDENRYRNYKRQIVAKHEVPKLEQKFKDKLKNSLKVIFTRDPYRQIFSYYVDNILVPSNESLEMNKRIISRTRAAASLAERACGHNVTFKLFTQYLMSSGLKRDLAGGFRHCDVCGVDYDVIGREDTLDQDTLHVYNKLKSKGKFSTIEDFAQERDFSRIDDYVRTAFLRKNDIKCLSNHTMYQRLWRQLQIYGFIGKNQSFPYDREESKSLEYDKLFDAVLKAYHSSVPMSRTNEDEAFVQAYHDILPRELENLRNIYLANFFLFGYQDRPARVFFKQGPQYEFNYFDLIPVRN